MLYDYTEQNGIALVAKSDVFTCKQKYRSLCYELQIQKEETR